MPRYHLIVLSNAVAGQEDEFKRWYDQQHLGDLVRVPGIVAAQRFQPAAVQQRPGAQPWQSMAIYECETDDLQRVIDAIGARAGTPEMPISSAFSPENYVCIFEPVTERLTA